MHIIKFQKTNTPCNLKLNLINIRKCSVLFYRFLYYYPCHSTCTSSRNALNILNLSFNLHLSFLLLQDYIQTRILPSICCKQLTLQMTSLKKYIVSLKLQCLLCYSFLKVVGCLLRSVALFYPENKLLTRVWINCEPVQFLLQREWAETLGDLLSSFLYEEFLKASSQQGSSIHVLQSSDPWLQDSFHTSLMSDWVLLALN